jgi:hypothetical protein
MDPNKIFGVQSKTRRARVIDGPTREPWGRCDFGPSTSRTAFDCGFSHPPSFRSNANPNIGSGRHGLHAPGLPTDLCPQSVQIPLMDTTAITITITITIPTATISKWNVSQTRQCVCIEARDAGFYPHRHAAMAQKDERKESATCY